MREHRTGRAVVTGASGFVGRHLVRRLLEDGWVVVAPILPELTDAMPNRLKDAEWPLLDGVADTVMRIMSDARPDVVIHLASLFRAEHGADDVDPLVASNVLFGTQVLEGMTAAGCRSLVNIGTSWQHYRDAEYDPVCLYAATKQALIDIARYYVSARHLKVITLELFDTYGPWDDRPKLVPMLLEAVRRDSALCMSPGEQLLDLLYVDDVVAAILGAVGRVTAPHRDSAGSLESFAVGANERVTLRRFVELFEGVAGRSVRVRWGCRPYRTREVMVPWAGGTRLPGWSPEITLAEGLRRTIASAGLD